MDMNVTSTTNSTSSAMGMDMGTGECQISMLWNWYTVDSCFLSATWHNTTRGMFAGSVIGVFLLCMAIEGARRIGREYDRRLIAAAKAQYAETGASGPLNKDASCVTEIKFSPSWAQQLIRGFAYGSQFTAAFLVMLLGMYFNGFILFAIFLGQTAGFILFGRDTCQGSLQGVATGTCC